MEKFTKICESIEKRVTKLEEEMENCIDKFVRMFELMNERVMKLEKEMVDASKNIMLAVGTLSELARNQNTLGSSIDSLLEKIDKMEKQWRGQVEVNVKHGKVIAEIQTSPRCVCSSSTAEKELEMLKEQFERSRRSKNIILYGVPESYSEKIRVKELLSIIAPWSAVRINIARVGIAAEGKIRPIRVYMSNSTEVNNTLMQCRKLKGNKSFETISVTRDRTKQQLHNIKLKRDLPRASS